MARSGLKMHGKVGAGAAGRSAEIIYLDDWRRPSSPPTALHRPQMHLEHWLIVLLVAACYAVGTSALL